MNVSLHQLKVFVAVARQQSFTRAAREFDLTQSAVSRCIRELEEAVELKLFDRTTRQVELTSAGASLERRIGRLLDEIDQTLREGRAAHEGHTGVVVMASNPVLSSGWVPGGLARCAAAFPDLVVSVRDLPQGATLASVEQGDADFGLISQRDSTLGDGLTGQPLFATPLCAVVPVAHPLAQRGAIDWTDLRDLPLVTLNNDSGTQCAVEQALAGHGVKGRSVQALGHIAAALRLVELGLGVGVLPHGPQWPALPLTLTARRLMPEIGLTTLLVRRRNRSLRPNAQAVWELFAGGAEPPQAAPGASSPWRGALANGRGLAVVREAGGAPDTRDKHEEAERNDRRPSRERTGSM